MSNVDNWNDLLRMSHGADMLKMRKGRSSEKRNEATDSGGTQDLTWIEAVKMEKKNLGKCDSV
jgi:hypothetical protein